MNSNDAVNCALMHGDLCRVNPNISLKNFEITEMFITAISKAPLTFHAKSMSLARGALYLPFDLARENYTMAVKAGLLQRSLLASARFGRTLHDLEYATLGVLARRR